MQWKGNSQSLPTYKGIRQGCRRAPFFLSCFTVLILQSIAHTTNTEWMRSHCTFYADDGHACVLFFDKQSMLTGLRYPGTVIEALKTWHDHKHDQIDGAPHHEGQSNCLARKNLHQTE